MITSPPEQTPPELLQSYPCGICAEPIMEQYSPAGVKYLPAIVVGNELVHAVCYFTPTVTILPNPEENHEELT